jgi:UDP-GlcNAc3NAcA epimerase
MLIGLEQIMSQQRPDYVLVYGDTNSTLAGALAASKLRLPIVHIEAGLRSFNREMPEEINRLLTDHCADILFCPTQTAVNNLAGEGITAGAYLVGDTMFDATLQFAETARRRSTILDELNLESKRFLLATLHRPYNTDEPAKIQGILKAFSDTGETVVFLVHPRTRQKIEEFGDGGGMKNSLVKMMPPVGYLDTLMLEQHARMILTDSGGMQKEAYFFSVPCVTLRPETEWVETVESGWNVIAGSDGARIVSAVKDHKWPDKPPPAVFGDGRAAHHMVARLAQTAASCAGGP